MRLLFLFFAVYLSACSQNTDRGAETNQAVSSAGGRTEGNMTVSVDLLNQAKWLEIKQRYKDKIIFINAWATWCLPCKEEFPDLVKLARDYQNSDVVIIGISVDYPDEVESKVIPFLNSQDVPFQNFVQNFKDPADLINMFNKKWRGAVPATFIYDKNGVQKAFLLGKQSYKTFKKEIEQIRNDR
jgi:thiol-disulfide isomerase/thioredoxin